MFRFAPAVARVASRYDLPRPLPTLRMLESWDHERFKVPLRDGDIVSGQSRNGVELLITGEITSQAGTLADDEQSMLMVLEDLRAALHVPADGEKYWLLLYLDEATGIYRHFRGCSTVKLELDLSDERCFTYSATIHADDPTLHATVWPVV